MSHASGQVIIDGKVVGFFEYDGTVDVVLPKVYPTGKELSDNWRKVQDAVECPHGDHEPCELYTNYGSGSHWPGAVCLRCGVITSGLYPSEDEIDTIDGHPLGHWNWPYDGNGNMLPDGVKFSDEPPRKG